MGDNIEAVVQRSAKRCGDRQNVTELRRDRDLVNSRCVCAIAFIVLATCGVTTQDQPPATDARVFEVASVKRSEPDARGQFQYLPGGRVLMRGINMRQIIQQAYNVRDFQIVGGPSWIGSDRYDIEAKAPGTESSDGSSEVVQLRLRDLLKDRFRLALHSETKEMSRYELVVGKGGPKLKEDGTIPDGGMSSGPGLLKGVRVDIRFVTVWLSRLIEQPVADATGLKGAYDFELRWAPGSSPSRRAVEPEPDAAPRNSDGPSIFTAIQEQLGLKLESRNGPVVMLVVDHAEKPTPD